MKAASTALLLVVSLATAIAVGVVTAGVWWLASPVSTLRTVEQAANQTFAPREDDDHGDAVEDDEPEPDYWIIGFGSVGPMDVSMTALEAIAAIGSQTNEDWDDDSCWWYNFGDTGLASMVSGLASTQGGATGPLDFIYVSPRYENGAPVPFDEATAPRTREGITIGSTLAELEAAYPGQLDIEASMFQADYKESYLHGPDGMTIRFSTNAVDEVEGIATGRNDAVHWAEGCA